MSTKSAKILKKNALIRNIRRLFSKLTKKHHSRAFKEGGKGGGGGGGGVKFGLLFEIWAYVFHGWPVF